MKANDFRNLAPLEMAANRIAHAVMKLGDGVRLREYGDAQRPGSETALESLLDEEYEFGHDRTLSHHERGEHDSLRWSVAESPGSEVILAEDAART